MMVSNKRSSTLVSFSLLIICLTQIGYGNPVSSSLVYLNDGNWNQTLKGEWLIEFYAPWCLTCRFFNPLWEGISSESQVLGIRVGQVDFTQSHGLSGRCLISELPTFFHVKEGEFRQYTGSRTKEEFRSYVQGKKWKNVKPLSGWQSPTSFQMGLISQWYRNMMIVRGTMNVMEERYGIPAWVSFTLFGLTTIISGSIFGMAMCYLVCRCCSSKSQDDDSDKNPPAGNQEDHSQRTSDNASKPENTPDQDSSTTTDNENDNEDE